MQKRPRDGVKEKQRDQFHPSPSCFFLRSKEEEEDMGWHYPDISLEEMVNLVKGFVDILILASGYQSSGLLAHWDSHNIKKAFQWASFFETVLNHMSSSGLYQGSIKELDAALSELTSDPSFPQGLRNLSSGTLNSARNFVLAHLFHAMPLRDSHLRAFLLAIVEMELDKLSESEHDFISVYLDKLRLQNTQINSFPLRMGSMKDSIFSSEAIACKEKNGNELTKFTIQQLIARQTVVSCISTIETGLDVLSNAIWHTSWTESDKIFLEDQEKCNKASESAGGAEISIDIVTWNCWKSKNLSYFLDRRTVALVSGSSLMFSAPQIQWIQVLERLNISTKSSDDDLVETIELLLLGCIASKWTCLIEYFMSVTYDSLSVSRLYHDVCNLLPGRCQSVYPNGVATNTKESAILEYLVRLLGGQLHLLWKLPPILSAIAIPYWSPLFRLYLTEIETEFKGDSSKIRYRCCTEHNKEDGDGQLAERIWCLYIFHVCGSHVLYGTNDPWQLSNELCCHWIKIQGDFRKKLEMKILSLQSMKRIQFLRWGKRIATAGSVVTLPSVKGRVQFHCCCGSRPLRQLIWKFRTLWKQAVWQKNGIRYSYDLQSYSLNFDDGHYHSRLSHRR